MPEPPRKVPLYAATVADSRIGRSVAVRCRACGHVAELPTVTLRERLPPAALVRQLGSAFRCRDCGHKGAEFDARRALGRYG